MKNFALHSLGKFLLPFFSGLLAVLGFSPFELFPAPLLSLALLYALLQSADHGRTAARSGFFWGLGCFLGGVSWIYVSMHDVGGMPAALAAFATLLFCAYLSLFPALASGAWIALRSRSGTAPWRDPLAFAGLWAASEGLRGYLFSGFPWLAVGYSQTPPSPLAGYAPWLGVYGLGLVLALMAALMAQLVAPLLAALNTRFTHLSRLAPPRRRTRIGLAIAWLALALLPLWAGQQPWTSPSGSPLTVALLQGNVAQQMKWSAEGVYHSIDTYTRLAAAHPAPLTVLPETSIPLLFDQIPQESLEALTRHGSLALGTALGLNTGDYANGAVLLRPSGAEAPGKFAAQAYTKRHLVPFGEYAPPGFDWFFTLLDMPMHGFVPGPGEQSPLHFGETTLWPTICYEDLFGEELIAGAARSQLLVNFSNTAWFGHSLAQPQHLQIARMRSLETGRPTLRATNTGMTGAIDAQGQVQALLPAFEEGGLVVTVQGRSGLTPYMVWGNGLTWLLILGFILPAALARRRARRGATS